jgi:hypothetical protein
MTTNVTVTEYVGLATIQTPGGPMQVPQEPPLVEQAFASAATSTQSAAFNAATTLVRINVDGGSAIGATFGTNPTATVPTAGLGSGRMAANASEFRAVPRGQAFKVAVINTV